MTAAHCHGQHSFEVRWVSGKQREGGQIMLRGLPDGWVGGHNEGQARGTKAGSRRGVKEDEVGDCPDG